MSLMISWGDASSSNTGLLYFDAVTAYTQNYSGKVSSHPIDGGGKISDHFTKENAKITLSAVITGVDISTASYLIADEQGRTPLNVGVAPSAVSVESTDLSVLRKFIPDSIGQFLPDSTPTITIDGARPDDLENIKQTIIELINGVSFNDKTQQFDPKIQLVKLYEYDDITIRNVIDRLVVTNIVFREDPNTGHGLYCNITLEQVTFAFLKKTAIPKDVAAAIAKKSESKATKGKQDSTPDSGTAPKDTDPLREAKANG